MRKQISLAVSALSKREREQQSEAICHAIMHHPAVMATDTVVAYWPLPDEPDIRPALRELHGQGKMVLLPHVINDTEMELRQYQGDEQLTEGAYGLMEPNCQLSIINYQLSTILVPGRAFDIHGHRLGRGKGYYDRFLAAWHDAETIAVCFRQQIVDNVPTDNNDITIKRLIWKISK